MPPLLLVDEVNVRYPSFYGDDGPEGWHAEMVFPVRRPLEVRYSVRHGTRIYVRPLELLVKTLTRPVTIKTIRSFFRDFDVISMHPIKHASGTRTTLVELCIVLFSSSQEAQDAAAHAGLRELRGESQYIVKIPDFNVVGPRAFTTRDILLVRDGFQEVLQHSSSSRIYDPPDRSLSEAITYLPYDHDEAIDDNNAQNVASRSYPAGDHCDKSASGPGPTSLGDLYNGNPRRQSADKGKPGTATDDDDDDEVDRALCIKPLHPVDEVTMSINTTAVSPPSDILIEDPSTTGLEKKVAQPLPSGIAAKPSSMSFKDRRQLIAKKADYYRPDCPPTLHLSDVACRRSLGAAPLPTPSPSPTLPELRQFHHLYRFRHHLEPSQHHSYAEPALAPFPTWFAVVDHKMLLVGASAASIRHKYPQADPIHIDDLPQHMRDRLGMERVAGWRWRVKYDTQAAWRENSQCRPFRSL